MRTYDIYADYDPRNPKAQIIAEDEYAALANYSVTNGYSDPRNVPTDNEDEGFFHEVDGTIWMTYENTELTARERKGK